MSFTRVNIQLPPDGTHQGVLVEWRDGLGSQWAEDVDSADVVIFWNWHTRFSTSLWQESGRVRREGKRCFAYSEADLPLPVLSGVYAGHPAGSFADSIVGGPYWVRFDPRFELDPPPANRPWLASFMGGSSSSLRKQLYRFEGQWSQILIQDTTSYKHWVSPNPEQARQQETYAEVFRNSHFILCPRGAGHSSIRIFEALQAGRVPVILDDRWLAPPEIDWAKCSLRFPEKELKDLPAFLQSHRHQAEVMGNEARKQWVAHLSPGQRVPYLVRQFSRLAEKQTSDVLPDFHWRRTKYRVLVEGLAGLRRGYRMLRPKKL